MQTDQGSTQLECGCGGWEGHCKVTCFAGRGGGSCISTSHDSSHSFRASVQFPLKFIPPLYTNAVALNPKEMVNILYEKNALIHHACTPYVQAKDKAI